LGVGGAARPPENPGCCNPYSGVVALKQALLAASGGAYSKNAYRSDFKLLLIENQ
jgi:hypothetical protein